MRTSICRARFFVCALAASAILGACVRPTHFDLRDRQPPPDHGGLGIVAGRVIYGKSRETAEVYQKWWYYPLAIYFYPGIAVGGTLSEYAMDNEGFFVIQHTVGKLDVEQLRFQLRGNSSTGGSQERYPITDRKGFIDVRPGVVTLLPEAYYADGPILGLRYDATASDALVEELARKYPALANYEVVKY